MKKEDLKDLPYILFILIVTLSIIFFVQDDDVETKAKKYFKIEHYKNNKNKEYFSVQERYYTSTGNLSNWNEVKRFKEKDSAVFFRNKLIQEKIQILNSSFKKVH